MAGLGQPQPAAPTVAVAPSKSQLDHVLNTVSGFAAAEQQAIQRRDQDVLKAAAVVVDPLAERTQAALTRFGMLKGKYAEHVGEMAGVNWPAVLRRVPRVRTPMTTPADANGIAGSYRRPVYEDNHDTINFLARTARDLAGAFTSDFPDLNRALLNLKNIASSPLQYIDANGTESTEYRQAVRHVEHYLKRAEEQVVTTAKMVENFLRLEAKVAADLAQAGPLDVERPRARSD